MSHNIARGFTLIELILVVCIIGFCAMEPNARYVSQIQQARDMVRLKDMADINQALAMYFRANGHYPSVSSFTGISVYLPKIPKDPQTGEWCRGTACDYIYTAIDTHGIKNGAYKLSCGFEDSDTIHTFAVNMEDRGTDDMRYETGVELSKIQNDTRCDRHIPLDHPPAHYPTLSKELCPNGISVHATGAIIITGDSPPQK